MQITEPVVANVLVEDGEVSDELDYAINRYIMQERGFGLVACKPNLVKLKNGEQSIRLGLDHTFMDKETNKMMGYGIVGYVYLHYDEENPDNVDVIYLTPEEEITENIEDLVETEEPQPRPRGKY